MDCSSSSKIVNVRKVQKSVNNNVTRAAFFLVTIMLDLVNNINTIVDTIRAANPNPNAVYFWAINAGLSRGSKNITSNANPKAATTKLNILTRILILLNDLKNS